MKKYWSLSLGFFGVLLVSTMIIRSSIANNPQVLGESTQNRIMPINPTEYSRRLTGTALRPTVNPTEYAKRLTGKPTPNLTSSAERTKRLSDQKLKICQEKSKIILKRSTQMIEMAGKMEQKFTVIAIGIKEYYVKKGLTLPNYNELVAAVDAKQKVLDPLLLTVKEDVASFTCTGDSPSELLMKYWTDMQSVIGALQDYRNAIKDLIVAVREIPITPSVSPTGQL